MRKPLPILLILSCAVPLFAADPGQPGPGDFTGMDLEQLMAVKVPSVYGASKREQKVTDAPSAVTIITRQDINEYGMSTLAEVIDSARGFYSIYDRAYSFLGVRGVNRPGDFGGRSLIMIDGHRLNDPIFDSALLGHDFPLDVELIDRVEVIRGPGSVLYGNNAFFDVINVVTRRGRDFDGRGVELSTSYGSFDAYSGRFSYAGSSTNGVEFLLSGSYLTSEGSSELYYPQAPNGFPGAVQRGMDGEKAKDFFTSLSYRGFTLEAVYGIRDKDLANGPFGAVFNDSRNRLSDERSYVEARYEHFLDENWHLQTRTYLDDYRYYGNYVYDYNGNGTLTPNHDRPYARWFGGEIQLSGILFDEHQLTLGLEARDDFEQHLQNYDSAPEFTYINETHGAYSVGVYAQDEYRIFRNLSLDLGLRFDDFSTFGGTINPRLGLIYHPWDTTTLKALYGRAYRAPNANEYYYHDAVFEANPSLTAETITSYELVWEQALARNYRFTGSLFYNDINSLITQQTDSVTGKQVFQNLGAVNVPGAEAELEAKWINGIRARASYAFSAPADQLSNQPLGNSPKHLVKAQLTLPLYPDRVFAGFEVLGSSGVATGQGGHIPGLVLANLNLYTRQIVKGLEFSAGIENILDRRYYQPVAPDYNQDLIPQDGRTFRLKLTYHF